MSFYSAGILRQEGTQQLYRRIRNAGYNAQGVRELTFGQALLDALEPSDWQLLEEMVAFLVRQAGWDATATRPTQDRGIDVLGTDADGRKFVAQVKHQQESVGLPIVQAAVGSARGPRASIAVVATSGDFTRQAKEWAVDPGAPLEVQLWDRSHLSNLIDGLNSEQRGELVEAVSNVRLHRHLTTVLKFAPSLSNIEARVQQAVLDEFGRLPRCWEHNKGMMVHLSGEYDPEVWWKCSVEYCPRVRDSLGEHRYLRARDSIVGRGRRGQLRGR